MKTWAQVGAARPDQPDVAHPRSSYRYVDVEQSNGRVRTSPEPGPARALLVVTCALTVLYSLVDAIGSSWARDLANLLGPTSLGAVAFVAGLQLVRRQPMSIWSPYTWFLAAICLFYALGPLAYVLGGREVVAYLNSSLPITVTSGDLLRANLLNAAGIAGISGGFLLGRSIWFGRRTGTSIDRPSLARIKVLAILLLVVGGLLQYSLILPWEFGMYDFMLPGVINNLSKLFLFGLLTLAYVAARSSRPWKALLYVLWSTQVLIAVLQFSKANLVLTLLLPMLGLYLAKRNAKYLVTAAIMAGAAYFAVAHLVHFGRLEIAKETGGINQATLGQRFEIVARWMAGEAESFSFDQSDLSALEVGWARLAYVNVQSFAMNRYDDGARGSTLTAAFIVLIPRIVWPDKPFLTDMAKDYYELVTGWHRDTHLGLGLFGEGYWNYGWPGVLLTGMLAGVVFQLVGALSMRWMGIGALEYLPGIFLGIQMGLLGTTHLFATAIVGGGGLIVLYTIFVSKALGVIVGTSRCKA